MSSRAVHSQSVRQSHSSIELTQNAEDIAAVVSTVPASTARDWRAVIICIAAFGIVFSACGTLFAFGVYQELYEQLSRQPNTPFTGATPASIDLIGTLSVSFMTIPAPFATAYAKRFPPQIIIASGGLLFGLGCIVASLGTSLWHFIVTQGLMLGFGTCLAYMPAVTIAPTWYTTRRGLAMGIILAGTGVGGLVWAPFIKTLNDTFGWRTSLKVSGSSTGGLIVLSAFFLDWDDVTKSRLAADNARQVAAQGYWLKRFWDVPLLDLQIARSRKFSAQLLASMFQAAAYYTPVFFFSSYAGTLGYDAKTGANFIAINNACNALGKIFFGVLADRFGRLRTLLLTTALSAAICFALWLPSTLTSSIAASRRLFICYSVAYGIFASPYVSLFPASLVELFGPASFAGVNGALYMARGLATLVGTPVAGTLIRHSVDRLTPHGYSSVSLFVGILLSSATFAVLWMWQESRRQR